MDWVNLLALTGGVTGAALLAFVAYRLGRISVLKEQATKAAEKKDEMLNSTVNYDGADKRLSDGTF